MESRNPIPALLAVRFNSTPLGGDVGQPSASVFIPKEGFRKADQDGAIPPLNDGDGFGIRFKLWISPARWGLDGNRTRFCERKIEF